MKIFCVGRNYAKHAAELGNARPEEPVIFMKPETALLQENEPFQIPEWSQDVHHELELVVRINRMGKFIQPKFALDYIDAIGLGIDFTARDVQSRLKAKGLPWELAKAFDKSAPISELLPYKPGTDLQDLTFELEVNGELRQQGHTADMIFSIAELIVFISRYISFKKGDLIYTGTPEGVAAVKPGDRLKASLQGQELLNFAIE